MQLPLNYTGTKNLIDCLIYIYKHGYISYAAFELLKGQFYAFFIMFKNVGLSQYFIGCIVYINIVW